MFNLAQKLVKNQTQGYHLKGREPSEKVKRLCNECDKMFDEFHGKSLRIVPDPLGKLQALILKRHTSFPPRIVSLFCKVKFFSRIRQLNVKLKLKTLNQSVRS